MNEELERYINGEQNTEEYKKLMGLQEISDKMKRDVAITDTIAALLPILHLASSHLTKIWITKAVDIVGHEKFINKTVFGSELDKIKSNIWFNDIIEQVCIQHAWHRKEQHRIDRLRKEFKKKRDKLTAKAVAFVLEHGTHNLKSFISDPSPLDYIQINWARAQKFIGIPKE